MNPVTHAAFADELEKLANAHPQLMVEVEATFGKEAGFLSSIFGGKDSSDVPAGAFEQAKRNSAAHAAQQATTRSMGGAAVDPFVKMRAGAAKTQVIPKKIPKFAEALTPEQLAKLAATLVNPAMARMFHGAPAALNPKGIAQTVTSGGAGRAAQGAMQSTLAAPKPAMPPPNMAAARARSQAPGGIFAPGPKPAVAALAAPYGKAPGTDAMSNSPFAGV